MVHPVPGPCDPEDLVDGIIFAATYLGCTHLLSERTPTKSARMQQAQEAMSRVRVRTNHRLADAILVQQIPVKYVNMKHWSDQIMCHIVKGKKQSRCAF